MTWRFYFTHGMNGIHTTYEWGIADVPEDISAAGTLAKVETLEGVLVPADGHGIVTLTDGESSLALGVSPADWL